MTPVCRTCKLAPAASGIDECEECWGSHEEHIDLIMVKRRAGFVFREARTEALREFVAKKAQP